MVRVQQPAFSVIDVMKPLVKLICGFEGRRAAWGD